MPAPKPRKPEPWDEGFAPTITDEPKHDAWKPAVHAESGLPCEMRTPGGRVLPLMMMPRSSKQKDGSWLKTWSPYLQVAHRIVWFREDHPMWTIETAFADRSDDWCLARATILNDEGRVIASASKQEAAKDFGDFLEKAETGAVGRALALCGYGTQFAPEFDEGERIVDSPIKPATMAKPTALSQAAHEARPHAPLLTPEPEHNDTQTPAPAAEGKVAAAASVNADMGKPAAQPLREACIKQAVRTGYINDSGDGLLIPAEFLAQFPGRDIEVDPATLTAGEAMRLATIYAKEPSV